MRHRRARCSGAGEQAGIADDAGDRRRFRRGPTWSAIIVPWLKPTSARSPSVRPGGRARRRERRRAPARHARRRASSACRIAAAPAGTTAGPSATRSQGSGACGETKAVSGRSGAHMPADVDQVVAVGAVAVEEHDQLLRRARRWRAAVRGPSIIWIPPSDRRPRRVRRAR